MQTVGDIWDSEELTPVQTRATLALLSAATAIYAFAWGDLGFHLKGLDALTGGQFTTQAPMIAMVFLAVLIVGAAGHMFNYVLEFAARGQAEFRLKPKLERQFSILVVVGCLGLALALAVSTVSWMSLAFPRLGTEGTPEMLRAALRTADPDRYFPTEEALVWMPGLLQCALGFVCLSVALATIAAVALETSKNELIYAVTKFYLSVLAGPGRWCHSLASMGGQGPALAAGVLVAILAAWAFL